ncbi:MAG TPA: hypothetical protein VKZ95_02825 [Sphingobacteriaceae bacterium]|nr:hypothetical protein [Sphingobacteriaceae bacterium]
MKIRLLKKLFFLILLLSSSVAYGQQEDEMLINNFIVKETLVKNNKLAILACDSLERPLEKINGTFQFTINGFNTPLKFQDGVAITPNEIENSTFVYLQHKNESGTHSNLFYTSKNDDGLEIYKISWFLLLLIPIALFILTLLFKRFLWLAIILFGIYLYYNSKKGLNIGSFLEIILDGIKNVL